MPYEENKRHFTAYDLIDRDLAKAKLRRVLDKLGKFWGIIQHCSAHWCLVLIDRRTNVKYRLQRTGNYALRRSWSLKC